MFLFFKNENEEIKLKSLVSIFHSSFKVELSSHMANRFYSITSPRFFEFCWILSIWIWLRNVSLNTDTYTERNLMNEIVQFFIPIGIKFLILFPPQKKFTRVTIKVEIYWEFRLFPRFSKFEVRARKSILGYLLNVIGYFNLGGVGRLPGYILSLTGPFLNFWILRS